ncbi:MAG: oligosaccharide flippase family protein [Ruminococcus sp.]
MSKTKSSGKQMSINVVASLVSFLVTMGINFFLTPYLVSSLGTESYGFIGLANNFVQYATIVTSALNSMSGRFISIAYHRNDKEKASRIFSSVLVADLVIAFVMLIVTAIITLYIDVILNVPEHLITDVKITFAITFLTFVISVVTAIFTTATYVKNRIDINSIRDIISNLLKVAVVVGLFVILPAKLYFLAIATLARGVFLLLTNITVKKRILPDVKIDVRKFEFGLVKVLIAAGIWMSLAQLSTVLLSGLDLLICNLTIGAAVMGIFSIAKTIPMSLATLISTLASTFAPHYTILYAKKNIKELIGEINFTSKIVSLILTVPIAGFIVFGVDFYTLWQPTKTPDEIMMIQILSILTCIQYLFTAHTQCLTMLNSVCNKMKVPVLVALAIGVISTGSVLVIINFFDLGTYGVYIIAGVSSLLMSLRAIIFIPIYSAYLLKQKKTTFYPAMLRGWLTFAVVFVLFMAISSFVTINSWLSLIAVCIPVGILGYIISIPLLFNKKELSKFKSKLIKR